MNNFIRKHKILTLLGTAAALIMLALLWEISAAARGNLDARLDLASGHYNILEYGLPGPERPEYVRLLHVRYGIEFKKLADCIVSSSLMNYANAYNTVSVAAIRKKFGHDVLQNTFEDSQRAWLRGPGKLHWQAVKYLFSYLPDKPRDPNCFHKFAAGSSMYKIVEQCGHPDEEVGSDAYIFVYHMQRGSTVIISGRYLQKVDNITYQAT